ncbi:MAG: Crp/Fnr family transcriptional regulator [Cytophagaceae bacterium]|nr:Crp/Fnr family transcriptional regulator [Cytophagaceae bacterium]
MTTSIPYETRYWYLRNHKLFAALKQEEIKEICLISNFKTARKGEIIYFSHDDHSRIYSLKQGIIKIVETDGQGHETIKDVLQKGDLFGQVSLDDTHLEEYAVVMSDYVTVCSFKITDFERVLTKNPSLAISFTKLVGLRFKRLENRYQNLMYKDVRSRFLLFLKEWAAQDSPDQRYGVTLKNYLTHQDIASLICSTRQTVSQLFGECRQAGLLDYTRVTLTIADVEKL